LYIQNNRSKHTKIPIINYQNNFKLHSLFYRLYNSLITNGIIMIEQVHHNTTEIDELKSIKTCCIPLELLTKFNHMAVHAIDLYKEQAFLKKIIHETNNFTKIISLRISNNIDSDSYIIEPQPNTNTGLTIAPYRLLSRTRLPSVNATSNNMGFIVTLSDSTKQLDFYKKLLSLNNECILDIGTGQGEIALSLISNNNIVLCNDINTSNLIDIYCHTQEDQRKNLYISDLPFPAHWQVEGNKNIFDSVIMHRVISVMPHSQVESGFRAAYKLLKDNGKLFIVTLSTEYPKFDTNKCFATDHGNGLYSILSATMLPSQAYNLPTHVIFADKISLSKTLLDIGFRFVENSYLTTTTNTGTQADIQKQNSKGNIGILATK